MLVYVGESQNGRFVEGEVFTIIRVLVDDRRRVVCMGQGYRLSSHCILRFDAALIIHYSIRHPHTSSFSL